MNKLILIGQQMSNICYNLSQSQSLTQPVRDSMKDLQEQWDVALKEQREKKVNLDGVLK